MIFLSIRLNWTAVFQEKFYLISKLFFHNLKMAYSALIEGLDRLTVKSVLRGSTATIIGIIGTLTVIILCLAIYIPPTASIIKGQYIQTEFFSRKVIKSQFYSNDDFKFAIVFRNRITNAVANHSQILDYALSIASEYVGASYYLNYYQQTPLCKDSPNYFKGIKDFTPPEDCFIFPQYSLFNVLKENGLYSYLYMNIYAQEDPNPFASAGGSFAGYQGRLVKLFEDYYYEVLFTSRVINPKGQTEMVANSFYSTQSEPTDLVRTSWSDIYFNLKNTTMDVSILPWNNYQAKSYMSWNGKFDTVSLLGESSAAKNGVMVGFTPASNNIVSYRYYKKIDLMIGYIGGAMLLFYIILWLPFNFINKTIHQIRNTRSLLLITKNQKQSKNELRKLPLSDDDVAAATPKICLYFLSNFLTNMLSKSIRQEYELVMQGQRQLDIIDLVKKLKVAERNLKKHNLHKDFKEKLLYFGDKNEANSTQSINMSESDLQNVVGDADIPQQIYKDQQFKEEIVDSKYQLTEKQRIFLRQGENTRNLYSINQTAMIIMEDQNGSAQLRQINCKKKYTDQDKEHKKGIIKSIGRFISAFFELFDFFGAKPNLIATPHGSSFVGFLTVLIIIVLTGLTAGVTISLRNTPQFQTVEQFQDQNNHAIQLTPGEDFNFVICSSSIDYLEGSNRYAYFRFFYENQNGRTYYNPSKLTNSEYDLFEISQSQSPINIQYCFVWKADQSFTIGKTPQGEGYFGFRFEPYCASSPSYCQSYSNSTMDNFLIFMNNANIYTFFPQNRFDPQNKRLVSNLVFSSLNINRFYMNKDAAMEQTIFLDATKILDDTQNYFARKQPKIIEKGLTLNPNTPYPISKMFQSSIIYHELKIKHSSLSYNYLITTVKTDSILALIGGVIVIWYAICHWLAKAYNNYCVRAAHADGIYGETLSHDYFFKKMLALSPIPLCLIPQCFSIRNQITRMRLVDKKVLNQLNYLWLIKSVNNVFQLSTSPLRRNQQKHLSMVFVKQKINQSEEVFPHYARPVQAKAQQFLELRQEQSQIEEKMLGRKKNNKVFNSSMAKFNSSEEMMGDIIQQKTLQRVKTQKQQQASSYSRETKQYFNDNYYSGHPKPMRFGWFDTFQYPASLTFKGKREVTSCVGGCFSILLLILIIVVVNFELKVYFDHGDAKTGKSTSIMQPLQSQSDDKTNSRIYLQTGADFKLAVTFSTLKQDVFQNVSKYLNNGTGISIFQKKLVRKNGVISTTIIEYPLNPCPWGYLTNSLSSIVDKTYYTNENYGYCISDGLRLEISGLPQDSQRNSFTLSIYNKLDTNAGRDNIRELLNNYYPKFHFTVPNKDFNKEEITYQITSLLFDPYNITTPVQQNISLSKIFISYDNRIGFSEDPKTVQTYNVNAFQQYDTGYTGLVTQTMYYNLTFDNSFLVEHYTLRDDKFYEAFGIIGGLIAFFIFGFGCIPRAYNNYRMRYLLGRELYLFDMSKIKMKKNAARGRKKKSQKQAQQMQQINYYGELNIFRAFLLSYIGGLIQNYNFDEVLRRVTLIQQKVEEDIDLIEVYRKIHSFKESIDGRHRNSYCDVSSIFLKPIYNNQPESSNMEGGLLQKIDGYSRKNNWTEFQRQAVSRAFENKVRLRDVFQNKFLEKQFNLGQNQTDNASRISQTEIAPTNSIFQTMSRRDQFSELQT